MKYLDLFKSSSLYDFVQNHSSLSDKQRGTILQLALKKSFSGFKFFLEKGTELSEQEIMDATILFNKVLRGADETFAKKTSEYLASLK